MRRTLVIHPFLVAAFPALFVCSHNIEQFTAGVVVLPVAVLVTAAAALWGALWLVLRDPRKAGIVVSLLWLVFFSYSLVREMLPQFTWVVVGVNIGPGKAAFGALVLLLLAGSFLAVRTRRDLRNLTRVLNVAAVVLVAVPTFNIALYRLRFHSSAPRAQAAVEADNAPLTPADASGFPDIYYIVMDEYGREDVLRDLYGYDNGRFTAYLRSKGFYVADRSTCNYAYTALALPSSLNLGYAESFLPPLDPEVNSNVFMMHDFMKDNAVQRFLKKRGYTTVAFSSGYVITELPDADLYLAPGWFYDEFPNALLDMTALGAFFHSLDPAENTRRRLLFMFDALKAMPERPGPKFVFAHFLGPHRPIVFGPNGEPVYPERLWRHYWLSGRLAQEYRRYYRDEVIFLNRKLEDSIDAILARSARPPVIILQGDTGPSSLLADTNRPTPRMLRERMSIFNSYYLEGQTDNALYPSITPVNSFRVVLNHSFGTRYPMLPDENYYSTVWKLYRLTRVTDIVREGATPAKP